MSEATIKKSGANLHLELSAETFDKTYCGHTITVAPPAQIPLIDGPQPCFKVLVQASNNNGQGTIVYVGNEWEGCHIELTPGDLVTIPINDVAKIHIRGSALGLVVNFMAMI